MKYELSTDVLLTDIISQLQPVLQDFRLTTSELIKHDIYTDYHDDALTDLGLDDVLSDCDLLHDNLTKVHNKYIICN